MNRTLGGAWALCAALACCSAHANRPLNTDTADTISAGRCQFEPFAVLDRSSGSADEHDATVQLNCGVSGRTQLGVAYTRSTADGDTAHAAAAAGKTQLIELKDGQTGISIAYGVNVAKAAGSGWSRDLVFANLIATRAIAPDLLGHVNLGTLHSRAAGQQSTTWGAALEWTLRSGLVASGEAYGDDRTRPWVSTGLWWALRDNLSVNVSAGMQTSTPRVRQVTAGFNLEF
jgi:hypothetical protein